MDDRLELADDKEQLEDATDDNEHVPLQFAQCDQNLDPDDVCTLADKCGCSNLAIEKLRSAKVTMPILLKADIGINEDDQRILSIAIESTNRIDWKLTSLIRPDMNDNQSDLSLLKLCSMISNATLHINCIDSSIISSESLIVRHRNEHKLHRLGYEDTTNLNQLNELIESMRSACVSVDNRLLRLQSVIAGRETTTIDSMRVYSPMTFIKYTLAGATIVATLFIVVQHLSTKHR